ncbi:MAG: 2Fe-2S iron-sulfur cluster binding domain-containing protein [Planctomycetes bacterium]|nr:2Fe-2S iron-sulfur cluster binding domain-containing protein [Planctomycetota bacterium]
MGGINPYIEQVRADLPREPYTLTFVLGDSGETREVRVEPGKIPYSHEGLPGSVLDIAMGAGVALDHACGGVAACSTCHVVLEAGADTCSAMHEAEEDMLDLAPGLTATSRLGCQCIPNGRQPVRVRIPSWNRNLASEGPH